MSLIDSNCFKSPGGIRQLRRLMFFFQGQFMLVRLEGGRSIASGLLLLAWVPVVAWAVLGCFLAGLGFYMRHNTLQTQATQMAPQARGTAVTLFACLLFLGQSMGVLVVAASVDRGWLAAVFTGPALGVLALGALVARELQARHRPA